MDKRKLKEVVRQALVRAENCWSRTGDYFKVEESVKKSITLANRADDSKIPGHPILNWDEHQKGTYICLFADLRDSSLRFGRALSGWHPPEKRVLFETLSLQAMFEYMISLKGGTITEFLGDGCLALFYLPDNAAKEELNSVYQNAWGASKAIIKDGREVLNECLEEIGILNLNIGVGLACSKAIVTRVGNTANNSAKVIGSGVYIASKLSFGENEIICDKSFTKFWPGVKGGTLKFEPYDTTKISDKQREFIFPMKALT